MQSVPVGRPEAKLVADALRDLVWGSGLSLREVNRRLGKSQAYMNQVLGGRIDLKIGIIVQVLEVVGKPLSEFLSECSLVAKKCEEDREIAGARGVGGADREALPISRGELRELLVTLAERVEGGAKLSSQEVDQMMQAILG